MDNEPEFVMQKNFKLINQGFIYVREIPGIGKMI